ncbi:class II aldolase/adducin family protein [Novosphingobium bradum]|uniref:Class II aldolase/adducin family protein n=1 Tax=Novosphingobium bradum TaxID=1737444 RepID=A0ABV7INF8_9SPHN
MEDQTMVRSGPAPTVAPPSVEELAIRRDLAAAYRLAALFKWDDGIGTHFTARLPSREGEPEAFLINPFGLLFEEVTASNLVKVDVDGNILSDNGYPVNRAGFVVHSAVHLARADAGCILHLHTHDGCAVAALEEGILPIGQLATTMWKKIAIHEYEGPAVRPEERERMARALGTRDLMILRNHGTMAIGATVAEAFHRMFLLETACSVQVRALSMGRPLHLPDQAVLDHVDANYGVRNEHSAHFARNLLWPAWLRKLDRLCPEYKD